MAFTNTPYNEPVDLGHLFPRCNTLYGYGVGAILQSTAATTRPKFKSKHNDIAGADSHAYLHEVSTHVSLKLRLIASGQAQYVAYHKTKPLRHWRYVNSTMQQTCPKSLYNVLTTGIGVIVVNGESAMG